MLKQQLLRIIKEAIEDAITGQNPATSTYQVSFEEDPVNYLLVKYPTLRSTLSILMTDAFKDYIHGIYVVAPRPTTFRVILHNNQEFVLIWTGQTYICKVEGKKYYLSFLSDKQRATKAIASLLELGAPIGTPGPEEQVENEPQGPPEDEEEAAPKEEEEPETLAENFTKKKVRVRVLYEAFKLILEAHAAETAQIQSFIREDGPFQQALKKGKGTINLKVGSTVYKGITDCKQVESDTVKADMVFYKGDIPVVFCSLKQVGKFRQYGGISKVSLGAKHEEAQQDIVPFVEELNARLAIPGQRTLYYRVLKNPGEWVRAAIYGRDYGTGAKYGFNNVQVLLHGKLDLTPLAQKNTYELTASENVVHSPEIPVGADYTPILLAKPDPHRNDAGVAGYRITVFNQGHSDILNAIDIDDPKKKPEELTKPKRKKIAATA